MKKTIFSYVLALITITVEAQWTDNASNLTTTDNVGIGTTSPTTNLDIKFSPSGSGINTPIFLNSATNMNSGEVNGILFAGKNNADKKAALGFEIFETGYFRGDFVFYLNDEPNHNAVNLSDEIMRFRRNGTLDLNFKPQGYGINSSIIVEPSLNMSSGEVNAILFSGKNNADRKAAFGYEIGETGYFRGDFVFYLNNESNHNAVSSTDEVMRIKKDGKVGIGTSDTGSHKLAVDGSIGAREIKVEATGWSDFVFEDDYEFRTLEEVEEHINKNGHLPEIPSEAEVTENGINLGEMDAKLLQKIEELTLYLIEQNKQNQAQQAKIELLEKKISQLENQ